MKAFRRFATFISVALLGASFTMTASAADIYKWVDANGLTHYSDSPPEDQKTEKMDPGLSRLTVIPMPKFVAPAPKTPSVAQRAAEPAPQLTVIEYGSSETMRLEEWRAQCIVERWVDCDDRRALYARYGTMADWGYWPRAARIGPSHGR